jgi:hypothetical protein
MEFELQILRVIQGDASGDSRVEMQSKGRQSSAAGLRCLGQSFASTDNLGRCWHADLGASQLSRGGEEEAQGEVGPDPTCCPRERENMEHESGHNIMREGQLSKLNN